MYAIQPAYFVIINPYLPIYAKINLRFLNGRNVEYNFIFEVLKNYAAGARTIILYVLNIII